MKAPESRGHVGASKALASFISFMPLLHYRLRDKHDSLQEVITETSACSWYNGIMYYSAYDRGFIGNEGVDIYSTEAIHSDVYGAISKLLTTRDYKIDNTNCAVKTGFMNTDSTETMTTLLSARFLKYVAGRIVLDRDDGPAFINDLRREVDFYYDEPDGE